MIPRLFPILAMIAALALVAELVARLAGFPGVIVWFAVVVALLVHALAFDFLRGSERRVRRLARTRGLPDWVTAQAEKNRRKGWVSEVGALPLVAVAACSGGSGGWPLVVFSACVAFQVGAFFAEFVIIRAQARLVAEVGGWLKTPDALRDEIG